MEVPSTSDLLNAKSKVDREQEQQEQEHHEQTYPCMKSKLIPIGKKFITIRKHNGFMKINIRHYVRDTCGKLYSTKRGIMLTAKEWEKLKDSIVSVDNILQERQSSQKDWSQ